jgi:hypothetical protein
VLCQNEMIQPLFIPSESPLFYLQGRLVFLSSISSFNAFLGFFNGLSCLLGISSLLEKLSMSLVNVSSPHMHV